MRLGVREPEPRRVLAGRALAVLDRLHELLQPDVGGAARLGDGVPFRGLRPGRPARRGRWPECGRAGSAPPHCPSARPCGTAPRARASSFATPVPLNSAIAYSTSRRDIAAARRGAEQLARPRPGPSRRRCLPCRGSRARIAPPGCRRRRRCASARRRAPTSCATPAPRDRAARDCRPPPHGRAWRPCRAAPRLPPCPAARRARQSANIASAKIAWRSPRSAASENQASALASSFGTP